MHTRLAWSTHRDVQTCPKTVRGLGDTQNHPKTQLTRRETPKHPETPQKAPKLGARRVETGLVEVGALVSFRSTVHGTTKTFAAWGRGPTGRGFNIYFPARLTTPDWHYMKSTLEKL